MKVNDTNSRIESKIDNLINMFTSVTEAQTILSQNQEVILLKLTEISTRLDSLITKIPSKDSQLDKLVPKVIENEESLNEFEQSLKDYNFVKEMTKRYSIICGRGTGRAINNAYALIDAMFDRKFLILCSWSGGSRSEGSKICFKSYKRVINFFFKIIHQSDRQFTMMECETFLKTILRNAKKRGEGKFQRASCQKRRMNRHVFERNLVKNKIEEAIIFEGGVDDQESDNGSGNETADWGVNEEFESAN